MAVPAVSNPPHICEACGTDTADDPHYTVTDYEQVWCPDCCPQCNPADVAPPHVTVEVPCDCERRNCRRTYTLDLT